MTGKFGRKTPYYGANTAEIATIRQIIDYDDFTDGAGTSGYVDVTKTLPVGALPMGWMINTTAAFANAATYTPVDGTTIAFVDGGGGDDTITDSATGFVTAGFTVGDLITVTGATTAGNNTTYTLTAVAAGTLTMATGSITTAEAGIAGVAFVTTVAAAVTVGISGDTDKYSADTARDIASVGVVGAMVLAADAADDCGTAQTIRITVTETTDFTDYEAGSFIFNMYYINTV